MSWNDWNLINRSLGARLPSVCFVVVTLCTVMSAPGCSRTRSNRGAVSGGVVLDGSPVADGMILFRPCRGNDGPTAGASISQGRYAVPGAKGPWVGWNRVEIRATRKSGKKVPKPFGKANEMIDDDEEAVAAKYNDASELEVDIKPGTNTFDFQVESR